MKQVLVFVSVLIGLAGCMKGPQLPSGYLPKVDHSPPVVMSAEHFIPGGYVIPQRKDKQPPLVVLAPTTQVSVQVPAPAQVSPPQDLIGVRARMDARRQEKQRGSVVIYGSRPTR